MKPSEHDGIHEVPTNLPAPHDFVGRIGELGNILEALSPVDRAWIVSLTGVGGIGKTELAIQAAYAAAEQKMFDAIVWTTAKRSWLTHEGIRPFEPSYSLVSISDLLHAVIDVLGLDPQLYRASPERKADQVKEALRRLRCLLVVDNLESVQDRTIIQFLSRELPSPCKALITTRLGGLYAPDTLIAQTLTGAHEIRIGPLNEDDAYTLFVRRWQDHKLPTSDLQSANKLQEIVQKTACIPLSIEWIVSRTALGRSTLDDALSQLSLLDGDILEYCFDNLISTVGQRGKKALLAISAFNDTVNAQTLQEVLSMKGGMLAQRLDETLKRLVAASLVEEAEWRAAHSAEAVELRYAILAPVRLYVQTLRLQLSDLYEQYCESAVHIYIRRLTDASTTQQWEMLRHEQHNMLALFSWCYESGRLRLTLQFAHALSEYLHRTALWDQLVFVCDLATVASANLGQVNEVTEFTYSAAEIHKARGRLEEALEEFRRCEANSNKIGDKKRAADAHSQVGIVLYHQGKYVDSIRTIRQSITAYRSIEDGQGEAQCMSILGRNHLALGEYEIAKEFFDESLRLKRHLNDQLGVAISLYDLGHFYHVSGQLDAASQHFEDALVILRHLGEKRHQSNAKWYYALLEIDRGNLQAAKIHVMDVIDIEEPLQRDSRLQRAIAKLQNIEAELSNPSSHPTSATRTHESRTEVDALSRIMHYLTSSDATDSNVATLVTILTNRWVNDPVAKGMLERFVLKPATYRAALEDIIRDKLVEDPSILDAVREFEHSNQLQVHDIHTEDSRKQQPRHAKGASHKSTQKGSL